MRCTSCIENGWIECSTGIMNILLLFRMKKCLSLQINNPRDRTSALLNVISDFNEIYSPKRLDWKLKTTTHSFYPRWRELSEQSN